MSNQVSESQDVNRTQAAIYVVETERGYTESFNFHTISMLERLGLIRHIRDGYVLEDGQGRGVGPLHRFFGPTA